MRIRWFVQNIDDSSSKYLFDSDGEIPRIGDKVYLRNSLGFGGDRVASGRVITACHVVKALGFDASNIEYPYDVKDRFTHAWNHISKVTGGCVNTLDRDHKQFVYTEHAAEVSVVLDEDCKDWNLNFQERTHNG